MVTPTRAPRAAPTQPARTERAALFLVAEAEAEAAVELLAFLLEAAAAAVVVAAAAVLAPLGDDWVARGAVDCPEI